MEYHQRLLDDGGHFLEQLPMRDVEPLSGDFAMELEVTPFIRNPRGGVQGGIIATLVDIVAGRALLEGLEPGHLLVTAELSVHYLGSTDVGPARAEAFVLRRGRKTCVVRVDVTDMGTGRQTATSTLSFSVLAPYPPAAIAEPPDRTQTSTPNGEPQ